ncbi:RNA methyltransferase [Glutamicibacter sp. MNS18]|uniref:TrmH family RNA methyltransferase n=1 Tax=Glutamicibacter sp. MNS18 TaxID=2989817 RepID=UPI0022357594|nr:RNA methyltransferase [Glutamicibacter sp. MNS18]MCW4464936.1 RNA methyltransferase [Glutamicibacter sp. MNS18]
MAEPDYAHRVHEIAALSDPRLDDYLRLSEASLRMRSDIENGIYIAESTMVVQRAISMGHVPRSFLLARKYLPQLEAEFARYPQAPIFVGEDAELEALTGFHLHRGALAAMERPAPLDLDQVLSRSTRIAVLEDIADHSNLGALLRSAAGLGVDAVLITPQCVDPLYRRSVRVSMGTALTIDWVRLGSWPADLERIRGHGYRILALELTEDATALDELHPAPGEKIAMILGNEGRGVRPETLEQVDECVIIPMAREVASLNVAAASAVAFWQLCSSQR